MKDLVGSCSGNFFKRLVSCIVGSLCCWMFVFSQECKTSWLYPRSFCVWRYKLLLMHNIAGMSSLGDADSLVFFGGRDGVRDRGGGMRREGQGMARLAGLRSAYYII